MASTAFSFASTLMAVHSQVNSSTTLSVRTFLPSRAVLDEVVGPDEIGVSSRMIFILALAAAGENKPARLMASFKGLPGTRLCQNEDAIEVLQSSPMLGNAAGNRAEKLPIPALWCRGKEPPDEDDFLVLHLPDPALAG